MWLRLDECGLLRTHVRSLWALRPAGMSTLHLLALIQSLAHQAHDDKVNAGVCLCLSVCVSQAACTTFDICCQAKIHTDTLTQTHTDTHRHTQTHRHTHTHRHTYALLRPPMQRADLRGVCWCQRHCAAAYQRRARPDPRSH